MTRVVHCEALFGLLSGTSVLTFATVSIGLFVVLVFLLSFLTFNLTPTYA